MEFVGVFHNSEADGDAGFATPEGFQDTPDQWYSTRQKKRGVGNPLADAATQRDSQATQVQSMTTQVQLFNSHVGTPSFVNAAASLSGDSSSNSDRRLEAVDEDETQIFMSLSQDREAMRRSARQIEEEELDTVLREHPALGDSTVTGADNSDTESDMSDDMLEQDGDINGLSSIAKSFQMSEVEGHEPMLLKKPSANVYKPRAPFHATPPVSVVGGGSADESSGAETEVEEEPETTQTFGTSKTQPTGASEAPPVVTVSVKKNGSEHLGKRSVSEKAMTQQEEGQARRSSIDRSSSCNDGDYTPERTKRARVSLGGDSKPPVSRPNRRRLDSADAVASEEGHTQASTHQVSHNLKTDAHLPPPVTKASAELATQSVEMVDDVDGQRAARKRESLEETESFPPTPTEAKAATPKRPTPHSTRKRRLLSQASVQSTEEENADSSPGKTTTLVPTPASQSNSGIRIMFTGLDGTTQKLRDKVKKIARANQEDDDVEMVTHLVAPTNQLKRTVKLLCGISCCDHILDERWLDESARSGLAASEVLHCLKDTTAEAKWNFSLYDTMYNVPKAERRALFQGLRFFITNHKSILPPVKDLVKIVECAGGHADTKGAATADHIVITSEAALALSGTKKAILQAKPDRVYTPEIILSSILQQHVDYAANRLIVASAQEIPSKKKRTRR